MKPEHHGLPVPYSEMLTPPAHIGIRRAGGKRWQASRPIPPPPRVIDVGSRLLALGALIGCVAVAGVGALR